MAFRSIGTRLTLWYTAILTLTVLFLGGIAYGLLAYSLSRDMDYALKGVAQVMARRARVEGSPAYPADVDAIFRRFFGFSPLDRHITIFNPRGERDPRRWQSGSPEIPITPRVFKNAANGISTFETVDAGASHPLRLLTAPVMAGGRLINLVRVGMPLANMHKTRGRFLLIMAAVLPLALILAGGGGWLLARRALRGVDQMTRAAQRISGEHLGERLAESGSGDELDRLAATLNDMLGRLDESFHQIRQFSADASHELQTPLTILKGELEVALRAPRSPEEYQRVLVSGLEEIDRINHLVESLLLLARADSGALPLDLQPLQLAQLLQAVCEQFGAAAESRGLTLQYRIKTQGAIQGDRHHLRRAILNLVDNALKYTPQAGRVTLCLKSEPNRVVIEVSDTGMGISRVEQELIFSRFHRATDTRARDARGVGLGLSIARSIAEAHGGTLTVASTPGQGSTFAIHLPVQPA